MGVFIHRLLHLDVVVLGDVPGHVGVLPLHLEPDVGGEDLGLLVHTHNLLEPGHHRDLSRDREVVTHAMPNSRGTVWWDWMTGLSRGL